MVHFSATHTETHEEVVVYQPLYGDFRQSVRPLAMFFDMIEYNNAVHPRFKKIAETSEINKYISPSAL